MAKKRKKSAKPSRSKKSEGGKKKYRVETAGMYFEGKHLATGDVVSMTDEVAKAHQEAGVCLIPA